MNRILYIFLIALSLFGTRALAQDFNPDSPPEPNKRYVVKVQASPAEAATTSGTGRYGVNDRVTVSASITDSKWQLQGWTDQDGNPILDYWGNDVGTNSSFTYKATNKDVTLTAHYTEVATRRVGVSALPEGAGQTFNVYVQSSGSLSYIYKVGTEARIYANSYSNWTFLHWKDAATDEVVSTSRNFSYTVPDRDVHLVAHYQFTPGSLPADPTSVKPQHKVFFSSVPANIGSFSQTSGFMVREESAYSVTAHNVTNWTFRSWTDAEGNVLFDGSNVASGVMGKEDVYLTANYYFNPSTPNEPNPDGDSHLTLYGQTVELYRGQSSLYPVYLENTMDVKAISVSMTVPEGIEVDTDGITTTGRASGYTVSASQTDDVLTFTLSSGTAISGNNGAFVHLPISAKESLADGVYDFVFTANTVTLADESTRSATFRSGKILVSTLGDDGLAARFMVDQLMNRVQFINNSTEGCKSFSWAFGDGYFSSEVSPLHIYAEPGTYTVVLAAEGEVKSDQAEETITIYPPSAWTSGGDYTLNSSTTGIRNFTSLDEAVTLLSQCRPTDPVVLTISEGGTYEIDLTQAETLSKLQTLQSKHAETGVMLKVVTPADKAASLSFTVPQDALLLQAMMELLKSMVLENTKVLINGVEINPAILASIGEETVCAGAPTTEVELSALGSDEKLTVQWTAIVSEVTTLSGYTLSGTGDLSSMTIANGGTRVQTVAYDINYLLDGVLLYNARHLLHIRPLLAGQTLALTSPADGAVVSYGNRTLSWTNLNSLATGGYTLSIQRTDNASEVQTFHVNTNSYSFHCVPGASYEWSVKAHGNCDYIVSAVQTFSVRKQADLMVESLTAPEQCEALHELTVTATIKNVGEETTSSSSWYDALYYSTSGAGLSGATRLATQYRSRALAPGESYEVEFTVKVPDASVGQIYYYIKADDYGYETETDEANNVAVSAPVVIAESYMNLDDYNALVAMYNAFNGEVWSKKWSINTNAINSTSWHGVTFSDDGRVTAISMADNNLSGTLPAGISLPMLKSLNLMDNNLSGDVPAFVEGFPALTSLNLAYCHIRELDEPLPQSITSVNLSYQDYGSNLAFLAMQEWQMGAKVENVELTSLMQYNHPAGDFSAHPAMRILSTNGSYLGSLTYDGTAYRLSLNGDYKLVSGTEVRLESNEGVASGTRLRGTLSWQSGDSNADGTVNVQDAQNTLNRILSRQSGNFNFIAANTYSSDQVINVQDVVTTINLFIVEETPEEARLLAGVQDNDAEHSGTIYTAEGGVFVELTSPVSALDFTLSGIKATQLSLRLSHKDYQMFTHTRADGVRVVIISPTGKEIAAGLSQLLRVSVETAQVVSVEAADAEAKAMRLKIADDGNATGIDGVQGDGEASVLYDLQGRRRDSNAKVPAGVYIHNGRKVIVN